MNNQDRAEKLLNALYEKMMFRGPLPEEGWTKDKIVAMLKEAQEDKDKEIGRLLRRQA